MKPSSIPSIDTAEAKREAFLFEVMMGVNLAGERFPFLYVFADEPRDENGQLWPVHQSDFAGLPEDLELQAIPQHFIRHTLGSMYEAGKPAGETAQAVLTKMRENGEDLARLGREMTAWKFAQTPEGVQIAVNNGEYEI